MLAIYRGALFFGVCRLAGWMLWAYALHHYPFDISWGGPHWVHAGHLGRDATVRSLGGRLRQTCSTIAADIL